MLPKRCQGHGFKGPGKIFSNSNRIIAVFPGLVFRFCHFNHSVCRRLPLPRISAIGWLLIIVGVLLCIGGLVLIGTEGVFRFVSGHPPVWMPTSSGVIAAICGIVLAIAGTFAIKR
jgi:vacuolar-type H+-ATPase subunit I/STV1